MIKFDVGSITEWIGEVIALLAVTISVLVYRRAGRLKTLDHSVELGKEQNQLRNDFERLQTTHDKALRERHGVGTALGLPDEHYLREEWAREWHRNTVKTTDLAALVKTCSVDTSQLSLAQAARLRVRLHAAHLEVNGLLDIYEQWSHWNEAAMKALRDRDDKENDRQFQIDIANLQRPERRR